MAERIMDTRSSAALLRHRWPLLLKAGLVGAVLGLLYAVLVPVELTSTSMVMVQGAVQSPTAGGTDIDTQVRLVQSRSVLERAGRAVQPALSARAAADKVTAEAVTAQLIEIRASSPRAAQAQALSEAVASAYVGTLSTTASSVTTEQLSSLRAREARLFQELTVLQDQIDATRRRRAAEGTSPEADRDAQLLAQLTANHSAATLKWDEVKKDLANGAGARVGAPAAVVQPATPATGPSLLSHLLASAVTGALLLGVLTAIGLLVGARRDPRLRTRDDLADAVGSTVLADVRSRPQRSVAEWSALFRTYEAPAVDAWAFRQVLRSLAASPDGRGGSRTAAKRAPGRVDHPQSVTVVTLAGDRRALAVGPQLASFAASLGISTRFVVAAGHSSLASLRAACSSDSASHLRAGLLLQARTEDQGPGGDPRTSTPPESFDELLEGLLSDPREGQDDPLDDSEPDPGTRTRSETPWGLDDDDVDEGYPVVPDGESTKALERAPVPDRPSPTEPDAAEHAVRVVPRHGLTDLTVVLVVADRRAPTLRGLPTTATTVLAISPHFGNREELARVAVAVDDAGRRIDGIVVADPDPADATTGRRTLDLRALETPLPLRTTGVTQLPVAGGDRGKGR